MNILRHFAFGVGIFLLVVGFALIQAGALETGYFSAFANSLGSMTSGLRPDFAAFIRAPLLIQVHAGAALAAVAIGLVQLIAPKGTVPHRTLGYSWAILMLVTAFTAVFIREVNNGSFSFIHIFIPITLMGLFGVISHARKMETAKHRNAVFSLFLGALIVPGLFAFMPGRLMWQMFFGG